MTHRIEPVTPRPDQRRVPVAVRARRRSARPDFDPSLRGRLLGPHQPPGLGRGRERAAGPALARLGARRGSPKFEDDVWRFANLVARGYQGRDVTTIGTWDDLDVDRSERGASA